MKKSFSLIEVLVAVMLLSIVMVALLQVQQNNLFFLDKFKSSIKYDEYLSLATINQIRFKKLRNENIYLDEIVNYKDDDIRKKIKNIKVHIKDSKKNQLDLSTKQYKLAIQYFESKYTIEDKISKKFYTFKLEY